MLHIESIKLSDMPHKNKESFAAWVRRVRTEKGLTVRDVESLSGGLISSSYVWQIENGRVTNVTPEKLTGLAKGLGVSEDELFYVARGYPEPQKDFFTQVVDNLTERAKDAPPHEREFIARVLKNLAESIEQKKLSNG